MSHSIRAGWLKGLGAGKLEQLPQSSMLQHAPAGVGC
jgi:hypothetical protein